MKPCGGVGRSRVPDHENHACEVAGGPVASALRWQAKPVHGFCQRVGLSSKFDSAEGAVVLPTCPVLSVRVPTQPTVRAVQGESGLETQAVLRSQDLDPHGRPRLALGT